MPREALLAQTMVQLADNLVDDFDVVDLLTMLSDRCVEVLDVAAAGLMLIGTDGTPHVLASSSEAMRVLELFELQANEGPCFDCLQSGVASIGEALEDSLDRWPRFAPEAIAAGFRSASAVPMRLRGEVIGALNLFRDVAGPVSADDAAIAQAFADVATIAILQHRTAAEARTLNENLTNALNSRIVIEQAKGVLAERLQVEMTVAFETLRHHARNHNLRLADLSRQLVEGAFDHGDLDPLRR